MTKTLALVLCLAAGAASAAELNGNPSQITSGDPSNPHCIMMLFPANPALYGFSERDPGADMSMISASKARDTLGSNPVRFTPGIPTEIDPAAPLYHPEDCSRPDALGRIPTYVHTIRR